MNNAMTKHTNKYLAGKHTNALAHAIPEQAPAIAVKAMVLDLGDGAFTDDSVKVKPHKTQPGQMVLKCTERPRLLALLAKLGITAKVVKGHKHYVAFVWSADFQTALAGQTSKALPKPAMKYLGKGTV